VVLKTEISKTNAAELTNNIKIGRILKIYGLQVFIPLEPGEGRVGLPGRFGGSGGERS